MIAIIVIMGLVACGDGRAPANSATAPPVTTKAVAERAYSTTVPVRAALAPWQEVELRARVSSFVDERRVDVGDYVRKGDALVRLSAPDAVAKRAKAEADLRSAEGRLEHLEQAAKTDGVVAPVDLETLRAEVDARRAEVAALTSIEAELLVRAPFGGIVTERGADPGALVGPGGPALVKLVEVDPLRLVASIPERFAASATIGQEVEFGVAAWPGDRFHARIARSTGSIDPATRTLTVEVDVPNTDGRLMPGMYAEIDWPVGRSVDPLFVPATAIVRSTEGVYVLAVREGRIARVDVRVGSADGADAEVSGDLRPGEQVIVRGSEDLLPGTPITARPEDG